MSLNSLTSPTSKSSPISHKLLQLDTDCNLNSNLISIGEEETLNPVLVPNDLLIFNEDNSKVAVRITATDLETLLPELTSLGFEVLGIVPKFNIVEGFINPDNISSLENLTEAGLLGVIPIYQPITNTDIEINQADNYDGRLVLDDENDSLISDTNHDSLDEQNYEDLIPSCDSNDSLNNALEQELLGGEIDNNFLSLGADFMENHDIIQNQENDVIYTNIFETTTNEIELDINDII